MLSGGSFEGCHACEAGEGGFVAASAGVGPGDVYLRGGDGAYSWLLEQLGCDLLDQFGDESSGGETSDSCRICG